MFSDKRFGLSGSLVAAMREVLAEKEDKNLVDPKKMKGGKTKVDLKPETDDNMKEGKEHTVPKSDKEKKLAALAHPKDKITHKDVLVGRGVLTKEEVDLESLTEEDLEEVLKKSQPAGEWIKDFVHSKDPKFAGKSKKKRMQMALGAYYAKQRNEEVELSAEELARIEAIAQSLDEINMNAVMDRAERKAGAAQYKELMKKKAADGDEAAKRWLNPSLRLDKSSPTKPATNEEVEELDENWSKGASRSYLTDRINAGKSLNNADHYLKRSKGAEKLNPSMSKELKIKYHREMAKFHKSGYHGEHPMAASGMAQAKKEVKKHKDAAAAIKSSMNEEVELDEAKPTIVSAPIRGANQDQSGENTRSVSTDYTISDSKKMKKEEADLDEAKRGRPKKNPTPEDEQEEHEHVIMQLRKVVSTHGALPVKHLDGKSTKITPQLAIHALNKHSAMKTAAEKQDFEHKMHKSHDSMKSALGQ